MNGGNGFSRELNHLRDHPKRSGGDRVKLGVITFITAGVMLVTFAVFCLTVYLVGRALFNILG